MDDTQHEYNIDDNENISRFAESSALTWETTAGVSESQACKQLLQRHYGARLRGLVLYGSSARGELTPESDLDLLVLLRKRFDYFVELRRIIDLLYPLQLASRRLISAKPVPEEEYEKGALQLYRNARKDGKRI